MANNCMVGIRIVTGSETDGAKLYDKLMTAKKTADRKREGIYIGCDRRYLFDAAIFRDRDTLQICGWVKWGFSNEEVKTFLAWLMAQAGVKGFHMDYDEPGCLLYGDYTYTDGKLVKTYLPEFSYPDDRDDLGIALETALKRYGLSVEIPMA